MAKTAKNLKRSIHGAGINDANYSVRPRINIDPCPIYSCWYDMFTRCYSERYWNKFPTYKNCTVAPEWHSFMNFRAWVISQDWEGKQLDKDILVRGNKIYSPEFCMFVSSEINSLLIARNALRGKYPIGVCFNKRNNKFKAQCRSDGKYVYLGDFDTIEEASKKYNIFKSDIVARKAMQQDSKKLKEALLRVSFDIRNGKYYDQ